VQQNNKFDLKRSILDFF